MGERRLCYGCMTLVELKGGICPFCGYNNNQPSKDPNCLTPGTILRDRYLIGVPCSMNGEGISYLAYDHSVGCRVIVREYMPRHLCSRVEGNPAIRISSAHLAQYKTLMADFTELHRELARLRGQIQINDVTDLFSDYNTTYVVMEFPEGVRLVDYLKQNAGELTWSHLSTMLPRFLTTLSILHNAGIVHRAISPETIYITESETMMITGFGIASVRTANTELECQIYGGYAAPEQYSANNRQGTWTDVYAVCAVIYRILTGCMPTTAISRMENDNLVAPGLLNPNVPEQVSLTVMAGLRIPSNDRIQTITELVTSLFHPSRIRSNGQQNQNRYMQTTSYSTSSMQNASPQADPNYDPYYDPSDYQRTDNGYADDYSYDFYENDGNYEAEPPSAVDRLKLPIIVGIILLIVLLVCVFVFLNKQGFGKNDSESSAAVLTSVSSETSTAETTATQSSIENGGVMPNLIGKNYENQIAQYDWIQFSVEEVFSDEYKAGLIVWQEYDAGTTFDTKKPVKLKVSKGSAHVEIPNYSGYSLSSYLAKLDEMKIQYKTVAEENLDYQDGQVIRLSVEVGSTYDLSNTDASNAITVYYADNPEVTEPPETEPPVETTAAPETEAPQPTEAPTVTEVPAE